MDVFVRLSAKVYGVRKCLCSVYAMSVLIHATAFSFYQFMQSIFSGYGWCGLTLFAGVTVWRGISVPLGTG